MQPDTTDLQQLADDAVALVAERGRAVAGDATVEGIVRATRTRLGVTRFANSFVHQHVGEDTTEVELVVAVDGRTASTSTTRTTAEELGELLDAALASALEQPVDPHWPGATPPAEVVGASRFDAETAEADPTARAELVRAFVDAGAGLDAAGYVDTDASWVAIATTAGQRAAGASTRATVDGIHQTPTSAGSAHQTSTRLGDLDGARAGTIAAGLARDAADFDDLDPGTFEVVLGPEAVATLLTFFAVYGFNAKMHLEGASFVELGAQQLDPSLTILDDPEDPRAVGLPFDAEGSPRRPLTLVDQGVSAALAHDRRTALRAGATTTGAAIPGGESIGAVPLNVRLLGGNRSREELIGGVERGLLITELNYVRVLEPKTQQATGLTRNGTFLIEDGAVTRAVGNLRFTESFLEALAPGRVRGVGADDRLADGEFGPGMVTCPSLHLAAFTFTGGARG